MPHRRLENVAFVVDRHNGGDGLLSPGARERRLPPRHGQDGALGQITVVVQRVAEQEAAREAAIQHEPAELVRAPFHGMRFVGGRALIEQPARANPVRRRQQHVCRGSGDGCQIAKQFLGFANMLHDIGADDDGILVELSRESRQPVLQVVRNELGFRHGAAEQVARPLAIDADDLEFVVEAGELLAAPAADVDDPRSPGSIGDIRQELIHLMLMDDRRRAIYEIVVLQPDRVVPWQPPVHSASPELGASAK